MPFEPLDTETKENMPPTVKITYMRSRKKTQGQGRPHLKISIPTTLIGTSKSERFEIQIGSGGDSGKIRIAGTKAAGKGIAPSRLKHAFVFNFGFVPLIGDCIFDGERRTIKKLTDEIYEIEVGKLFEPGA